MTQCGLATTGGRGIKGESSRQPSSNSAASIVAMVLYCDVVIEMDRYVL